MDLEKNDRFLEEIDKELHSLKRRLKRTMSQAESLLQECGAGNQETDESTGESEEEGEEKSADEVTEEG